MGSVHIARTLFEIFKLQKYISNHPRFSLSIFVFHVQKYFISSKDDSDKYGVSCMFLARPLKFHFITFSFFRIVSNRENFLKRFHCLAETLE